MQQSERTRLLQQRGAASVGRLERCGARYPSARRKLILCSAHQGPLDVRSVVLEVVACLLYNVQQSKRSRRLQQCGAVSVDRLERCGARCPSARRKLILCFAHQGHLDALGGGERDDDHNSKSRTTSYRYEVCFTTCGENRKNLVTSNLLVTSFATQLVGLLCTFGFCGDGITQPELHHSACVRTL